MAKINNCKLILFIISFIFLSLLFNSEVLAHGGEVPTQTLKSISDSFIGVWQGKVSQIISKKKSSTVGDITLTLCVQDGNLNGTVNQEGVYSNAAITPTQVISKKDVVVTLNDIQGNANTLRLVTVSSKKLKGSFSNNLFIYTNKINTDGCLQDSDQHGGQSGTSSGGGQLLPTETIPIKLKSIGIEFSDFRFTRDKLQFGRLFTEYGFYIPAGNDNPAKYNPQPTFIVPLGTQVRSLIDGIVVAIPKLWSGDYSVQVTSNGQIQKWVYETEHLINPRVQVSDKVTAGQIVGEVGNFNDGAPAGFGTVEIGILKGGNPPQHVCPFAYLDDSIKEETFKNIKVLFKSWEEYVGDQTLYDESMLVPGCLTLDLIDG